MMTYEGTCHCGSVEFRVESDLANPVRCNCSFCVRRGALLKKVPADQFELTKGDEFLSVYGNRDFSDHFFCKICGIHTFTRITHDDSRSVVVSLACLGDVDIDEFEVRIFDGATLL